MQAPPSYLFHHLLLIARVSLLWDFNSHSSSLGVHAGSTRHQLCGPSPRHVIRWSWKSHPQLPSIPHVPFTDSEQAQITALPSPAMLQSPCSTQDLFLWKVFPSCLMHRSGTSYTMACMHPVLPPWCRAPASSSFDCWPLGGQNMLAGCAEKSL